MKKLLSLALCAVLWAPLSAETMIHEIVITASRTDSGRVAGVNADAVESETIEVSNQTQVEEVLNDLPGIQLSRTGGPGSQTSLYLRGADSKNVLVLIDGVMVNDPGQANRGANLADLTLDNIERIEVIKGPQSVLYGSNATSGVVNIITKSGGKPEHHLGLEAGSFATYRLYAGSKGRDGKLDYSASLSRTQSEGISSAHSRNPDLPDDGNTDEKDSWENQTASMKLKYHLEDGAKAGLTLRHVQSAKELDDVGPGYLGDDFEGYPATASPEGVTEKSQANDRLYYGLNFENRPVDGLDSNVGLKGSQNNRILYDQEGEKNNSFQGTSQELSWQGSWFLGGQQLTLGLARMDESLVQHSFTSGESQLDVDQSTSTNSLWLQDQMSLSDERLEFLAGVRMDQHAQFGSVSTYRLAPAYHFKDMGLKLKTSFGTGFRSPSLYELYGAYTVYGTTTNIGNEDLTPEKSSGWDVGVVKTLDSWQVEATYYQMVFTDRIDYVYDPVSYAGKYQNQTGDTQVSGTELAAQGPMGPAWEAQASVTLAKTEDPDGEPLARRAEQVAALGVLFKGVEDLKARFEADYKGKRPTASNAYDAEGNPVEELDAYTLLSLSADYKLTGSFEVYGRVNNLSDAYYEEAWSYGTPGRNYLLGLKAVF